METVCSIHFYGTTYLETTHLKFRQIIHDHIAITNIYTEIKGSTYLSNTKMTSITSEGIMTAAPAIGIDIYVYHKMGNNITG